MKINPTYFIAVLIYLALSACGGGGGGGGEVNIDFDPNDPNAGSEITVDAGADQDGSTNTIIRLDGSNSSGPSGDTLIYLWTFSQKPASSNAFFSDPQAIDPSFQPDVDGTYVIKLVVSTDTDSAQDTITIRASSPIADAGANQTVAVGSTVTLDGSLSSDGTGALLNYSWEISLQPQGSTAVIPIPAIQNPTFITDVSGTYVVSLVVNNGIIDSIADSVTISAVPPTANAGPDQNASTSTMVTLDGSASSDISSLPLEYLWQIVTQPAGSATNLLAATVVNPTFIPDVDGVYVIGLTVNNGVESSSQDTVTVVSSTKPVAIAGADQNVSVGELVTLDGSQSNDANGSVLSYGWSISTKPPGSNAFLSNLTSATPSFTPDIDGDYTIELLVNNGSEQSDPDTLVVTASSPIADGGGNQNVAIGSLVQLNANFSSDPNGNSLTYNWQMIMLPVGSSAVLSSTTAVLPTITVDLEGEYLIELTVNNGFTDSEPLVTTVNARTTVGENSGIFSTSFEGTSGNNWSISNGIWEVGVPTSGPGIAYVGQKLAATNLVGDYPRNFSKLISPPIQIPVIDTTLKRIKLNFWHWFSFHNPAFWFDYGILNVRKEISIGVWDDWVELTRYSINSGTWSRVSLDGLSSYSGETVQIGFELWVCPNNNSLCVGSSSGWYIDEVLIEEVNL